MLRVNCFILLCLVSLCAWSDKTDKLTIVADSSLFNFKTGLDTYEGHVKIDQGTMHLIADRLITRKDNQHKIEEAIAYQVTQPVEYRTQPKPNETELHATAAIMKFYPQKSTVILEGHVTLTQGENSFHGPTIIYNIQKGTVVVPASKRGRAMFVIHPK